MHLGSYFFFVGTDSQTDLGTFCDRIERPTVVRSPLLQTSVIFYTDSSISDQVFFNCHLNINWYYRGYPNFLKTSIQSCFKNTYGMRSVTFKKEK
jgi:hypothetical protein